MEQVKKISEKIAMSFAGANFFLQLTFSIVSTYLAIYLTDSILLSAAAMGSIIGIGGIIDTISVFVCGGIVQNTQLKWGKFRSWLILAPFVYVLGCMALFTNYQTPVAVGIVIYTIAYAITTISSNFLGISLSGLIAVVATTQEGRIKITGRQNQLHNISRMLFGAIFLPAVAFLGGGNNTQGYLIYTAIIGVLTFGAFFILFKVTAPFDQFNPNIKAEKAVRSLSLIDMVKVIIGNSQVVVLLIADIAKTIGLMISFMIMAYYFQYAVGNMMYMGIYLTVSTFVGFLGTLVGPIIVKFIGKNMLYIFGSVGYGLAFALIYIIYSITGVANPWVFLIVINIGVFLFNCPGAISPTFYMDAAEYGFHKYNKDATAFVMSFMGVPFKLAIAIAGIVTGVGLTSIGYAAGVAPTKAFVDNLVMLVSLLPAGFFFLNVLIFQFGYKLTDQQVEKIMEENRLKRVEISKEMKL